MTSLPPPASSAAAMRSTQPDKLHAEAMRAASIASLVEIATLCVRVPAWMAAVALAFGALVHKQPDGLAYAALCVGCALIAHAPVVVARQRVAELQRRLDGGA